MDAKEKLTNILKLKPADEFEVIDNGNKFVYKLVELDNTTMQMEVILLLINGKEPNTGIGKEYIEKTVEILPQPTNFFLSYKQLFDMDSIRILDDTTKPSEASSS